VITRALHHPISWARSIQSISPTSHLRSNWILFSPLSLGLPSCLFPPGFPRKILYE
jgi:hypothetical protein